MNHVDPIAPQISLIIPVYNCERFLPDQLDALLGDAAMSMEVIAVDDGSSGHASGFLHRHG